MSTVGLKKVYTDTNTNRTYRREGKPHSASTHSHVKTACTDRHWHGGNSHLVGGATGKPVHHALTYYVSNPKSAKTPCLLKRQAPSPLSPLSWCHSASSCQSQPIEISPPVSKISVRRRGAYWREEKKKTLFKIANHGYVETSTRAFQ